MRVLSLIILLTSLFLSASWGKTYSCRDSSGKMHYSDNLQGLPEECLGKEKVVKPGARDNLIFVPPVPEPDGSGIEFQHSVRDEERRLQKQRDAEQQSLEMQQRAERLLERYQEASQKKRKARRSWSYSSREIIKRADEEIERAREGKRQLLQELESASLSKEKKEELLGLLTGIADE